MCMVSLRLHGFSLGWGWDFLLLSKTMQAEYIDMSHRCDHEREWVFVRADPLLLASVSVTE